MSPNLNPPPNLTELINAQFPGKLSFLFQPHRYKVAWGGRGAAKSWGYARALIIESVKRRLRILCCRETQASIDVSVHSLLKDQIDLLGLQRYFTVGKKYITGTNGTEFLFAGLKHNVRNIKGLESADICWIEEAQGVSKDSWDTLTPTIRKEGSEIWATYNPDLPTDETHQRFVIKTPPPGSVVVKISYRDNPWFPETLRIEAEALRRSDPDSFAHIWEGNCISVLKGAIYANELRQVDAEGRITRVPYDRSKRVDCFWDLGYGDKCAIWFVQQGPFEYRIIDYLENEKQPITWYLSEMQSRGYVYGRDYLPWDLGMHAQLMGHGKSIEGIMREVGRNVEITPRVSIADGINAVRTIFPQCWFDGERCQDGLTALRHYRYGMVEKTGAPTREPVHDSSSHASDAFRYLAVGIQPPEPEEKERRDPDEDFLSRFSGSDGVQGGWMR